MHHGARERMILPYRFSRTVGTLLITFLLTSLGVPAEPGDWTEFRGPWNGHAAPPDTTEPLGLPLRWSETENVVWKTPIPHRGLSSPIILGGQVWLTTATEDGTDFFVLCIDANTGEVIRNDRVFHVEAPEPLGNSINTYASPTPVAEPGRVYVHFGTYGTACLDADTGKVLWERRDLPCRHYRGPGSSPILFEDLLFLTFDGIDIQYVTALDKRTGETVWRTDRSTEWKDILPDGKIHRGGDYRKAFSTPLVVEVDGTPQLISLGACAGFAYDARTGQEIWKTHHGDHSSSARPLQGLGHVFVTTGHGKCGLWAIRPDGTGDITDTHVTWKVEGKMVPKQPSPVLVGDLLFMVSNEGRVSCLDAATGAVRWQGSVGGNYMASVLYGDGRLYLCNMQGETTVLATKPTLEVLAENRLESGCLASPAVSGRALFLRTKTHLYRIEDLAKR